MRFEVILINPSRLKWNGGEQIGKKHFGKEANIYVCLYSQHTFQQWKKALPPGSFTQITKADPSGKATFSFKEVPKGEYVIIAFVDGNGNGKLDCDTWGFPQEPLGLQARNEHPV